MPNNAVDTEVFIYMGPIGTVVPRDVVRVRVDPSVTSIPAKAFYKRTKLTEVELCEGLVEIGECAFRWCNHSITKINIPTSLRRINDGAFSRSLQCPIHDGIESIGTGAFLGCIFTNFRVPPLITMIPKGMLRNCNSTFSVEMPKNVTRITDFAFAHCYCLRNLALPPNAVIGNYIFCEATDLLLLFDSIAEIIRELQNRFDGLPVHSLVYFQSYYQGELQRLLTSGNDLDPMGNQQDCLGMTPLHILACSSVHNLEVYRLIVEMYPANLITEDRWGAVPLLYAFWGGAPTEIIKFLLDSYRLLYPDYIFNWTMMVETMGQCHTPKETIESLLCAKQMHFQEQPLDWEYLLTQFASSSSRFYNEVLFQEQMHFLFMGGMSVRVEALAFKLWRDYVTNMIQTAAFDLGRNNSAILHEIYSKFAHFEEELTKLKDVTTILELALWKMKISKNGHQDMDAHDTHVRSQDWVTCGADVVIGHVLPFLINTD
jgi:hypothetical protein